MSFSRGIIETVLRLATLRGRALEIPDNPPSIFVLRNNDIGDLLVITPLFEALKRRFPSARVCAGVGQWNFPVLTDNPWVDQVLPVSAPWHNKQTTRFAQNSVQGWSDSLRYLFRSPEIRALRNEYFAIGIDVLGSPQGSLLLLRAGIPFRIGVRGYAGGHRGCQRFVDFDPKLHVGRSALRVAELLGATRLPENRPQIFLTEAEKSRAEQLWRESEKPRRRRVIIAPGSGLREKCWPVSDFAKLAAAGNAAGCAVAVIGGPGDKQLGTEILSAVPHASDWTGKTSLRETFALIATSDVVLTNSSMAMHVAAGFKKRTAVFLGPGYASARDHHAQWGYDGDFLVLGAPGDSAAGTAEAAAALLQERGWFAGSR